MQLVAPLAATCGDVEARQVRFFSATLPSGGLGKRTSQPRHLEVSEVSQRPNSLQVRECTYAALRSYAFLCGSITHVCII